MVFGREDFIEYIGARGEHGGPAERTRLVGDDPLVYTNGMKGVTTERQQTELIMRLELRQAHSAVPSVEVPSDGVEGEEREGVEQTIESHVAVLMVRVLVRRNVVPQDDVVGGGEGAAEALGEESEEEVNGGRDNECGSDDNSHYHNGRRRRRGGGEIWR